MVLGEVENNTEEFVLPTVEIKKDLPQTELTDEQTNRINQYLELSHDNDEEDMERLLGSQLGNHFWTQAEKTCLVYFVQKVDGDYEELRERYFSHRSCVALKTQYRKILKGLDTPATTPRLSISNISAKTGNSLVKLLTPKASPMKKVAQRMSRMETIEEEEVVQEEEEEDEKLLKEMEQVEEEEEEEKAVEKKEEEEEALPEECEIEETNEKKMSVGFILAIVIPILLVIIFHIFVILVPEGVLNEDFEVMVNHYKQAWTKIWLSVTSN